MNAEISKDLLFKLFFDMTAHDGVAFKQIQTQMVLVHCEINCIQGNESSIFTILLLILFSV